MDMDDPAGRNRHPWFVLAPAWNADCRPDSFEDDIVRAKEFVESGVTKTDGVFPGHHTCTTVARLRSRQAEAQERSGPFMKFFGKDFEFGRENTQHH